MLIILLRLLAQDIVEKSEARGEPYTVWRCIKDLLIVYLLIFIESIIFFNSYIILHTPDIQQGDGWVKPTVYGATFIVMWAVAMGYMSIACRIEKIIRDRRGRNVS